MSEKQTFVGYIGTYTKGDSKGVYSFELDTAEGTLKKAEVAAELTSPTYVRISPNEQFLYAVSSENKKGGLTSFSIDRETGKLTKLTSVLEKESSPCHVSVHPENDVVAAAYYHDGTATLTTADASTGELKEQVAVAEQTGSGPNEERQDGPHMHYTDFTPDGKYLIGVDLGTDEVVTYEYSGSALKAVQRYETEPGAGPRHLAFHPNGVIAYLLTELSNDVVVLRYHAEDGSFETIQTITSIPEDFTENSQGSAIRVSSDGRFVYAGNRGHDSIAIYEINPSSYELTLVEYAPSGGNWPRDFILDPTEQFLISTNQESSNIVLYKRDVETGKLTPAGSELHIPDPVCVTFLTGK